MPRVHAGRLDDLPDDRPVLLERAGRRIALMRLGDVVRAVADACPHAGGPLSEGRVRGQTLICPHHGWVWSLHDGRCVAPHRDVCAVLYATTVEAGEIWIELPDA
jgi:nitrite reductase/ring-hydroxylating ferredoxin subunit